MDVGKGDLPTSGNNYVSRSFMACILCRIFLWGYKSDKMK
jgi:hypothetical protein